MSTKTFADLLQRLRTSPGGMTVAEHAALLFIVGDAVRDMDERLTKAEKAIRTLLERAAAGGPHAG